MNFTRLPASVGGCLPENHGMIRPASAVSLGSRAEGLPFGKGIDPRFLRIFDTGTVRVSIGGNLARFASRLSELGRVQATTQNAAARIAQRAAFPALSTCACGRFATNALGGFGFDLHEWRQVWMTRTGERQAHYSIAVQSQAGTTDHHVALDGDSMAVPFALLACQHQGATSRPGAETDAPGHPGQGYAERFRSRGRGERAGFPPDATREDFAAVQRALGAAWEGRFGICATVLASAAIQSALFVPERFESAPDEWMLSSCSTTLRLQRGSVREIWRREDAMSAGGRDVFEFYDAEGRLLLGVVILRDHTRN